MKLKTLFIINAIFLGASGISAVLKPAIVCSLYGVDINPEVLMMSQYAGLGSIVIALVAWFSRNIKDSSIERYSPCFIDNLYSWSDYIGSKYNLWSHNVWMACYCFVLCICDRVCLLSIFWSIQGLNV
jgi:hypothetical protein